MLNGYNFYDCMEQECRHCFVSPVPSDEELLKAYDIDSSSIANSDGWTLAEDYKRNPKIIHEYCKHTRLAWLEKVACEVLADKMSYILDIGCSTGMFLRTLKDLGYSHLQGLDISPDAARFVSETHGVPCVTRIEDLPEGRFDLITCYAVLEHVGDPIAFVQSLSRKLKPNGKLAVLVPNYNSYYRKIVGKSWVWLIPPVHLQYFNMCSLRSTMEKVGLKTQALTSGYSGTYLYLVVYHIMKLLGRQMPSTSRSRDSGTMAFVEEIEKLLRLLLWPMRKLAKKHGHGNELLILSSKC